jgi:2-phospho-L-lactate guanylyltransferase (CobY/MobA/RfbA family)
LVVDDPGGGLDQAAAAAAEAAIDTMVPWLILHADLPLVTAEALVPVVAAAAEGPVIAPSHNGGTSALGGSDGHAFSYGPASFHTHLVRATHARVFIDYRLAVDVDTPRDLAIAARLPGGDWLRPFLGSLE